MTRRTARLLAWMLAALQVAATTSRELGAQVPPAAPRPAPPVDTLFDARTNAALQQLLQGAIAAGLPDAPLRNRMRQGAARGVAGDRVLALVRAHADSMRVAREALGARASADELDAGAAALHAGATRAMLRRLRAARVDGTATTAMVVLTDLLWRGVAPGDAADAVATIAQRSPDRALVALQGAVAREGAPATARALKALVDRVAPAASDAGARQPPRRSPLANDTLPARSTSGGMTLSSLSAPASGAHQALVAEGHLSIPIGHRWEAVPRGALRAGVDTRWGAAMTLAREFHPAPSLSSRLWVAGELRAAASSTPDASPLPADRPVSEHGRRSPDLTSALGGELLRRVGPWTVGTTLSVGRTRFSRLQTQLVQRTGQPTADSLTPRPDTLRPRTEWVAERRWSPRTGSAATGAVSLQRGDLRIEGGVSRQLGAWWGSGDSTRARRRMLFTVGAEHRVAPWASLVGQWMSHDPSAVHGTLLLTDARWRLGVRIAERPARPPTAGAPVPSSPRKPAVRVDVMADSLAAAHDGAVTGRATIRVQLAGLHARARAVEVEGDITAWRPIALTATGKGIFVGAFPARAALVRLRLRIDGGAWFTPPGVATQRDDFGDEVAVFVLTLGA